jgi:hypothetical protein
MTKLKHILPVLIGLTSTAAFSQSLPSDGIRVTGQAGVAATGVQPKTENGITYACGGVGDESAANMKQAASNYDLMVTFAAANGAYLADVDVDIADSRGRLMLSTTCGGPLMLVDFQDAGKYRIRGQAGDRIITRTARVREGGRVTSIAMTWPVQTVDMGLRPTQLADTSSGELGRSAGSDSSGR